MGRRIKAAAPFFNQRDGSLIDYKEVAAASFGTLPKTIG